MADNIPDGYMDGCTIGPQKFGRVSHRDICDQHDIDWWVKRTLAGKIKADFLWSVRLIKRHATNGLWILPATLYAVLGFIVLNTVAFPWWKQKHGCIMRLINNIIIHCSATTADKDIGAAEIDVMHRNRGFAQIGYHWVVRRDGKLEGGRDEATPGAHTTGWNAKSIGVCLVGGIDRQQRGEANFTDEQMAALDGLLKVLLLRYPSASVIGHRDTGAKKDCPSFDVKHWLATGKLIKPRNLK